ncbi:MAG: DUF5069 domain-containing protein [Opitutales bacterium]
MSAPIVPTISPLALGPLGLYHLPRLWQKCLLAVHGRLPEGYKAVGPGFDYYLLDGIHVDREAVMPYFHAHKPSYVEFEAWIREQPGVKLDPETIEAVNRSILHYDQMSPERQAQLGQLLGLDNPETLAPPLLVALDSWEEFRQAL